MKLNNLGPNQTELKLNNGTVIFFSYEVPCAAFNLNPYESGGFPICKTSQKWSKTTSKHINKWVGYGAQTIEQKEQSFFDNLVN